MKLRDKPLIWRFRVQLIILSVFFLTIILSLALFSKTLTSISGKQLSSELLKETKEKIKVTTTALATSIGDIIASNIGSDTVEIIRKAVDNIRYEKDKSGYVFVYKGTVNMHIQ